MIYDDFDFKELTGKTLTSIKGKKYDEIMMFKTSDDEEYALQYDPDCCASCSIEEIVGNLDDIIGSPILLAEEVTHSNEHPDGVKSVEEYEESFTWTFYKLSTIKGSVTIRWYGSSNGYYSERATFKKKIDGRFQCYKGSI